MEDYPISYAGVYKLSRVALKIPTDTLEINKNNIETYKCKLLTSVDCSNLDDYIRKIKRVANDRIFLREMKKDYSGEGFYILKKDL
jgi:hypothetical protein